METRIPVKNAKIRIRIGPNHFTREINEGQHFTSLILYRGEICLEALVWKEDFGYPGKGKKRLRIPPERYGLGTGHGIYDKDIVRFRKDGTSYIGKVEFRIEEALNEQYPWHIVTSDGGSFLLKDIRYVDCIASEIEGAKLEEYGGTAPVSRTAPKERKNTVGPVEEEKPENEINSRQADPVKEDIPVREAKKEEDPPKEVKQTGFFQNEDTEIGMTAPEENKDDGADEVIEGQISFFDEPPLPAEKPEKPEIREEKEKRKTSRFREYAIYTDGSSLSNPGPCGGAYILVLNGIEIGEKLIPIGEGTNNIAELTAVIEALKDIKTMSPEKVRIISDSQYVIKGATEWHRSWEKNGWVSSAGKPVLNIELWKELLELTKTMNVEFVWVKGHDGDLYNEKVDKLAKCAASMDPQKKEA